MALSNIIATLIEWLNKYWFLIPIVGLGLLVLHFWSKSKKEEIKYYDQIKVNKKLSIGELEFNPTEIKTIRRGKKKWSCIGEIIQAYIRHEDPQIKQQMTRAYTIQEIRDMKASKLRDHLLNKPKPDFYVHTFAVKKKRFLTIPFGQAETIKLFNDEFTRIKPNQIRIHDNVWLIYRDGFYCSYKYEMIGVVSDKTERLLGDLKVSGLGQQQKDFSRIRTDYAHTLDIKEKDIEAEKEKDKAKRF
jgi:hypothetical protein